MVKFVSQISQRLDLIVSNELKISRNQATNLIKDNLVTVNLKLINKPSYKICENDNIIVEFGKKKEVKTTHKVDFDIPIIYEDEDLLVLNKPPQIVIHSAPSLNEATLVDWLNEKNFMLSNLNGDIRPGIVHRLDRGTSGAIVVSKNNFTHTTLSAQLSDKSMGRIYLALTDLKLKQNCIIDRPIGRSPHNRLKNAVVENGKFAKSAFTNLLYDDKINLIAAKLFTGRTHQIRVHLASINRHILGDNLYGFKSEKDKIHRVMLHAYLLYFIHPRTGKKVSFTAPIYNDFSQIVYKKFSKELFDEKISIQHISDTFNGSDSWLCIT